MKFYSLTQITETIASNLGFELSTSASGSSYIEKNGFTLLRISNHENKVMFRNELNAIAIYNSSDDSYELEVNGRVWRNMQFEHIYNVLMKKCKKTIKEKYYLFN